MGLSEEAAAESGPTPVHALWLDFLLACAGVAMGLMLSEFVIVVTKSSGLLSRSLAVVLPALFLILILCLSAEGGPANRSLALTRGVGAGVGWVSFALVSSAPDVLQTFYSLFYYSIPTYVAALLSAGGAVAAGLLVANLVWRSLIRGRRS